MPLIQNQAPRQYNYTWCSHETSLTGDMYWIFLHSLEICRICWLTMGAYVMRVSYRFVNHQPYSNLTKYAFGYLRTVYKNITVSRNICRREISALLGCLWVNVAGWKIETYHLVRHRVLPAKRWGFIDEKCALIFRFK